MRSPSKSSSLSARRPSSMGLARTTMLHLHSILQPADQQLPLEDHLLRQIPRQLQEQLLLPEQLALELFVVDALKLPQVVQVDVEARKVDVLRAGHPADRALEGVGLALATVDDPLQHAHVL